MSSQRSESSQSDEGKKREVTSETSRLLPFFDAQENRLDFWNNPWLLSIAATSTVLIPTLIAANLSLYALTYRTWPATLCAAHLTVALTAAFYHTSTNSLLVRLITTFSSLLDVFLCGVLYPNACKVFELFFVDVDGTVIDEWASFQVILQLLRKGMLLIVMLRIFIGGFCWFWIIGTSSRVGTAPFPETTRLLRALDRAQHSIHHRVIAKRPHLRTRLRKIFLVSTVLSIGWLSYCLGSCVSHFTSWHLWWESADDRDRCCDSLDLTECALPFPSFHHMLPDPTSSTGWRVDLEGNSLPLMRGGIPLNPTFLNTLDGFSTMAPILFYLDGLKESHEAEIHGMKERVYPRLVNNNVKDSITERSITLLWNVEMEDLVPHTAQVDYLDPERPIIIVVPSKPLHHATHYALAVINATDENGNLIPPTPGMQELFSETVEYRSCPRDYYRLGRYHRFLIPSLQKAAPWVSLNGTNLFTNSSDTSLQLMFDFVTMSEDSLIPSRTVRDGTLDQISTWKNHTVQIVKVVNQDCKKNNTLAARFIHGSLTVPWWLSGKSRESTLSPWALKYGWARSLGRAKFIIIVPCSLRAAALNETTRMQRPLRAVVEYGHGLFYNRAETYEHSLLRVAEDQGYLIMAMDWRGMSSFDMPVVMKTALSTPSLFQATRDNLIQGYANKLVLQHFAQNGLLDSEWLRFVGSKGGEVFSIPRYSKTPTSIFYGSSQGGILGAGYTTLLGPTGLINRAILGVPGASFSLIMSRSGGFETYDGLLIKNFYHNRHVRILLSILQLGWDPVEATGMLAPPVKEKFPPILLQSGLGDAIIPTMATEALARAYNASVLPGNPRKSIFGIRKAENQSFHPDSTAIHDDRPRVTWTEILYEKEYQNLPIDNVDTSKENQVHMCLRQDCALIAQMAEFINTGQIVDPCYKDNCLRTTIPCYLYWKETNTKPSNWTCTYNQTFSP